MHIEIIRRLLSILDILSSILKDLDVILVEPCKLVLEMDGVPISVSHSLLEDHGLCSLMLSDDHAVDLPLLLEEDSGVVSTEEDA